MVLQNISAYMNTAFMNLHALTRLKVRNSTIHIKQTTYNTSVCQQMDAQYWLGYVQSNAVLLLYTQHAFIS